MRRRDLLASVVSIACAGEAGAQGYPVKPIKIIVPFSPGGTADALGRLLAAGLQRSLGQPVVIESRPGANGVIGADAVAKAAPDGYTLLLNSSAQALNESLFRNLPFDARMAFRPVALVLPPVPFVIVSHPSLPVRSLAELQAYAKTRPDAVRYGSAGVGNGTHVGAELLARALGIKMLHVPYKGAAQALNDLVGGQIDLMLNGWPSVAGFVAEGKLRALGQTSVHRAASLSKLETVAEAGHPGFDFTSWFGLYAPAATPGTIVDRLNEAVMLAMKAPDAAPKIALLGADAPTPMRASEFAEFHRMSSTQLEKLVRSAGIALVAE